MPEFGNTHVGCRVYEVVKQIAPVLRRNSVHLRFEQDTFFSSTAVCCSNMTWSTYCGCCLARFCGCSALGVLCFLENLALRQQLVALRRRRPRLRLTVFDRFFRILAHRFWSGWKQVLMVVTPETVVRWHRAGFRWYWSLISKVRKPAGRRPTSKEVRDLLGHVIAIKTIRQPDQLMTGYVGAG